MNGGKPLFVYDGTAETRWFTAENPSGEKGAGGFANNGRKGSPCVTLADGEEKTVCRIDGGTGIVRRIWMAVPYADPDAMNGIRIRMFWDRETEPAADLPIGPFFMHCPGEVIPFDTACFSSLEGRTCLCTVPMPFRDGCRIVLANQSGKTVENLFYEADVTVGDSIPEDALYFHAAFTAGTGKRFEDLELLPEVRGRGRYLGTFLCMQPNPAMPGWWGEGEVKLYLDGEQNPTLCGTGTEDYFGFSWGLSESAGYLHGCLANKPEHAALYRFHLPDPVFFKESLRVTVQSLGLMWLDMVPSFKDAGTDAVYRAGDGRPMDFETDPPCLYEREGDEYAVSSYYYLNRPGP